jgi:glycosyltransferase involved in cell wall biosynthesis
LAGGEGTRLVEENIRKELFDTKMRLEDFERTVDVTIGICVKDNERTIKETIESVLNQTFDKKRTEIIVVDDSSSDRTLTIIAEIVSKADIKVNLYSTNGGGLTVARQMVVDNSCGDYLVFVDGDMILSKDFIQKQVDTMNRNLLIGVAGAKMEGRLSRNSIAELEGISQSRDYELGIHRNWRRNPKKLGTGGSIFRLAAIREAGGFDTRIRGAAEDADITARIKSAGYLLFASQAVFEHEFKQTLKGLWNQYAWYGHGMHYFYHKHKDLTESVLVNFWPISFAWSIVRSILSFKTTHRRIAFLLPSFNLFKATAWWFGFFEAHQDGYGHEYRHSKRKR